MNSPQFSCLDVGKEVLASSFDGCVYRYQEGALERMLGKNPSMFNREAVSRIKQVGDYLYVSLVKGFLRIYKQGRKITEFEFEKGADSMAGKEGLFFFSFDNYLYKMEGEEIKASKSLKRYRKTNFIRNLQLVREGRREKLVFLYDEDVYFLDTNLRTKLVKLAGEKNPQETVWGIYCC